MKKITLIFISITFVLLFIADIEISSLYPLLELSRILKGLILPDFSVIAEFYQSIINTLVFAFCGITIGVVLSIPLSLLYKLKIVKLFCSIVRSVHEIFWAFLLLPILGLYPLCGVFAIAIPYSGILAKGYYEIFKESDLNVYKEINKKLNSSDAFFYTVMPIIYNEIKHFTFYRLECAIKSSAVLGFIGLPTIGFHLESFFRKGMYAESASLLFVFYAIIALLKYVVKEKVVPVYCLLAFTLLSKKIIVDLSNVSRFFTYEIIPWPMRRDGFIDGTNRLVFKIADTAIWLKDIVINEGIPGIINTIIVTQIAFTITGVIAVCFLFTISKDFFNKKLKFCFNSFLIVMRTTPEYVLAYILLQIFGPSMLPGILAIAIHNGAIVSFLTLKSANQIEFNIDSSGNKLNRYVFEVLPRIYGIFLANLFYRWEVMIRESAILGILGIYTIGFYIDSAISDDKMDKAIILIISMILLNGFINYLSSTVRHKIRKEELLQ